MKAIPLALLLALPGTLMATEIRPGDTLGEVRATLGAPQGQLRIGDRQVLYYNRGEIELQAGTVTRVALLSVEEQAVLETKRAADAVRVRDELEVRRARLSAEGEALKARKLTDPSFQAAPLAYQVAFWQDFSRRYPDVPSTEQLTIARLRLAEQIEARRAQAEQAERLAELQARVIEAEARAADAESAAYAARNNSFYRSARHYSYNYRDRQPVSLWPVEYRFFDSPLPYATSPGMPPMQPTYRSDYSPSHAGRMDNSFDFGNRNSPKHDHHSDRDARPFFERNRL